MTPINRVLPPDKHHHRSPRDFVGTPAKHTLKRQKSLKSQL